MPQQNDLLMELLLGGNDPDATAQFIAQAFMAGRTPGDQGAAYQNVLTNLSPSVIAERKRLGPQPGEALGEAAPSAEDMGQVMQQLLGLQLSPQQQGAQQLGELGLMNELLTGKEEREISRGELKVKESEAETKATAEERLGETAVLQDALLKAQAERLAAVTGREEAMTAKLKEMEELRMLGRTGRYKDGTPIGKDEHEVIKGILGLHSDPDIDAADFLRTAQFLLNSGVQAQMEQGALMLAERTGIDVAGFADPSYMYQLLQGVMNKINPQPIDVGGEGVAPGQGGDQDEAGVDQRLDVFRQELMEQLGQQFESVPR